MNCRDMVDYLSDYLDGELDASIRMTIETHNGECPPCRAFVKTLRRTVEMVRASPCEPLPPALRQALYDALRKAR